MTAPQSPVTRIGTPITDTTSLKMCGRDTLTAILGKMSFAEAFYLIVTDREAGETERKVMDAALIVLMDHGITPTAMVARLVADSVPDQPQMGIAAGLMMIGDKFAGTMSRAGEYLLEGIDKPDHRAWAQDLVARKRRLAGFGHPYYRPTDPRADRIFEIARAAGVKGRYIDLLHVVHEEIVKASGKPITLNVTGALGAVLCEIGFPVGAMRGVAVVGRAAGLVAHVEEERRSPITPLMMDASNKVPYRE
jgi:citrate synthase